MFTQQNVNADFDLGEKKVTFLLRWFQRRIRQKNQLCKHSLAVEFVIVLSNIDHRFYLFYIVANHKDLRDAIYVLLMYVAH